MRLIFLISLALVAGVPATCLATQADRVAVAEAGATKETAIKVNSVPEEYALLRDRGLRLKQQALVFADDHHPYDVLTTIADDGSETTIWFDIKSFFVKELQF